MHFLTFAKSQKLIELEDEVQDVPCSKMIGVVKEQIL